MNGGKEKATSENSSETADVIFPSEVSTKLSVFDRFATYVSAPHRHGFRGVRDNRGALGSVVLPVGHYRYLATDHQHRQIPRI